MRPKLAVFDCDGTLVDSQHSIAACMTEAFAAAGLTPPAAAEIRRVVGLPLAEAIWRLSGAAAAPDAVDRMAEAYSGAWGRRRAGNQLDEPLFEGIDTVLAELADAGWLLGVATGKSMRGLAATLDRHGLGRFFVTLQTADRARGKPDPEMLLRALEETETAAEDAVMIGDTTYDMEMARRAGVRPVGVAWGYHAQRELIEAGASAVAASVADIGGILTIAEELPS